ncbi:MAG: hypothetical protein EOP53_20810 [Sphingobacteriales bacterium]|nr:MAG: hypothetical protein EOP53_20810 [Sphingobacteriales bacterium]
MGYDTFFYENNNIIREEHYSIDYNGGKKILYAVDYQYDDKINPKFNYDKLLGEASYNNIVSTKNYWDGALSWSSTSKFTYNASGYPVKEEKVLMNGNKSTIIYAYSCK